jgi:hypothetical protein
MSTATELLRRALDALVEEAQYHNDIMLRWHDVFLDIRTYLAAEQEAEPVAWMFQHEDTGLIDYVDTQQVEWGFEKNNPRWQKIGPVYLHPPKPAEKEAQPVAWMVSIRLDGRGNGETFAAIDYLPPPDVTVLKKVPLYTRPEPAIRKPMTEEEIAEYLGESVYRSAAIRCGFISGVRFAEKHHLIGVRDE